MGVLIDWPGAATAPQKFVFLVSESRPPACAVATLEKEQQERAREELNALYVALTRAKNTLVVSSIEPHRETTRSWWQRLQPFAQEVAAPAHADPATDDAADTTTFTLAELPELSASRAQVGSPAINEEESDSSRFGQAMHRLLELGVQGTTPAARRAADAVARQFKLQPAKMIEAIAMAHRIRSGEAAWVWSPAAIAWEGNEVELMVGGQSRRIDRLVRRRDAGHEGHWWVIDYKSVHQPERDPELLAQMAAYRAALQAIYPDDVVKAAFLTGRGALVEVT